MALWKGLDRAIGTEFADGSEQEISSQIPMGEVRRAIASVGLPGHRVGRAGGVHHRAARWQHHRDPHRRR
jgi:hypothetical protein